MDGSRQSFWTSSTKLNVIASMQVDGTAINNNCFRDITGISDIMTIYPRCWSLWAKKNVANGKGQAIHVSHPDYVANDSHFAFMLASGSSTYLSPGTYLGMHAYAPSMGYYINISNKWADANWHCFHINFNSYQQADVYMDGTLAAKGSSMLNFPNDSSYCNIEIGGSNDWGGQRNFAGLCTRVVVWNRPLTASEIAEDYAMKNTGVVAPKDLLRFYGGMVGKNNELYNCVNPNDGHLLVPYGNSTIS